MLQTSKRWDSPLSLLLPSSTLFLFFTLFPFFEWNRDKLDTFIKTILNNVKNIFDLTTISRLISVARSKQTNRKRLFVLKYLVSCDVDISFSSSIGISSKTIISYVHFSLILLFKRNCFFQFILIPPIVSKKTIRVMIEFIILSVETILIIYLSIICWYTVVPNHSRVRNKLMHL